MKIVATTSLPAVDRPNADRWNAARLCQYVEFFKVPILFSFLFYCKNHGRSFCPKVVWKLKKNCIQRHIIFFTQH